LFTLARTRARNAIHLAALLLVVVGSIAGCDDTRPPQPVEPSPGPAVVPLKVGVSGNFPPLIYERADGWAGIEVDLAKRLAGQLGRPLEMVATRWNQLIPALLDGRIDIIMAGMTITDARKVRIAFSEPYMRTGLYALMRTEDRRHYASTADVRATQAPVGVVPETTGDVFLRNKMPHAVRWAVSKAEAASFELANHKIDLFISDAPSVMWLVSENEAELVALTEFLDKEYLGWGMRRDDQSLLNEVNAALRAWRADGSLQEILRHWVPYQKELL
jgi:polar amino acid transport system substrate-binding protein